MSAKTVPYAGVKYCDCGQVVRRTSKFGRAPETCEECRAKKKREVARFRTEKQVTQEQPEVDASPAPSAEEVATEAPPIDALAIIAQLRLDYAVGSAVRFLLELHDGDELENLKTARQYLDAAIAAREAA